MLLKAVTESAELRNCCATYGSMSFAGKARAAIGIRTDGTDNRVASWLKCLRAATLRPACRSGGRPGAGDRPVPRGRGRAWRAARPCRPASAIHPRSGASAPRSGAAGRLRRCRRGITVGITVTLMRYEVGLRSGFRRDAMARVSDNVRAARAGAIEARPAKRR